MNSYSILPDFGFEPKRSPDVHGIHRLWVYTECCDVNELVRKDAGPWPTSGTSTSNLCQCPNEDDLLASPSLCWPPHCHGAQAWVLLGPGNRLFLYINMALKLFFLDWHRHATVSVPQCLGYYKTGFFLILIIILYIDLIVVLNS